MGWEELAGDVVILVVLWQLRSWVEGGRLGEVGRLEAVRDSGEWFDFSWIEGGADPCTTLVFHFRVAHPFLSIFL